MSHTLDTLVKRGLAVTVVVSLAGCAGGGADGGAAGDDDSGGGNVGFGGAQDIG